MAVLALLLALLVFVPEVALVGAWARPASLTGVTDPSAGAVAAPAELLAPSIQSLVIAQHVVVLSVVAMWCSLLWLGAAVASASVREPLKAPGRRGRAVLQAYLN
jgi:hypothetical protein